MENAGAAPRISHGPSRAHPRLALASTRCRRKTIGRDRGAFSRAFGPTIESCAKCGSTTADIWRRTANGKPYCLACIKLGAGAEETAALEERMARAVVH